MEVIIKAQDYPIHNYYMTLPGFHHIFAYKYIFFQGSKMTSIRFIFLMQYGALPKVLNCTWRAESRWIIYLVFQYLKY